VKILYLAPELVVRGSTAAPSVVTAQAGQDGAAESGSPPVPLHQAPSRRARGG
jgi:hypothetical protein